MKKVLFVAVLVTLASAALSAQDYTRSNGVPSYVTGIRQNTVGHIRQSNVQVPPGLVTIYSNLGSSSDAFDFTDGWLILGPSSAFGTEQWIGYAFTPTQNHVATQIQAPVFWFSSGANSFEFSLYKDASGVPGTILCGKSKKNLPTWTGTSADTTITAATLENPVKLTKGHQYWVVIRTNNKNTDSEGAWDFVWNDATGTQAYNLGSGWSTEDVQISAFAVFGTS
jgi:hypothetical protein